MKRLSLTFFCFSVLFRLALGLSPTYLECQLQRAGESPLKGCPEGTIYVSLTDSQNSKFSSIQAAINSLPDTDNATILIGAGEYHESLNVTRRAPLTLLGQLDPTTASIPAGNASQRNLVHVWNNLCVGIGATSDEETAILTITYSLNNPFGNTDFKAFNINFENRASIISQALALSVTLAKASFYGCTFASRQDTVFVGWEASVYIVDSVIFGEIDYLFGLGTCYIQSSILANRACGGGITAWSSTPGEMNGIYIADSKIIRSWDADPATVTTGQCFLGRPWNQYAVAVFLRNYMDDSINSTGFTGWNRGETVPSSTYYAEFRSHGPGGDTSGRISQDHILDLTTALKYGIKHVFEEREWIDLTYTH